MSKQTAVRTALFVALTSLLLLIFLVPFNTLIHLSLSDEHFSHTFVVPPLSAVLLFRDRHRIFKNLHYSGLAGTLVAAISVCIWAFSSAAVGARLSLQILALVVAIIGIFIFCYGLPAFNQARFACLLVLLMVPIPPAAMATIVYSLQVGSAAVAEIFFRIFGTPAFRDGLSFVLPGFVIQVAVECSGIRSTLALLVTTLLASYLFLRSGWTRLALCMAIFPLAVLKNGFRIAVLSWLGLYVSPAFLHGSLHRDGGFLFFTLALLLLIPIIRLLQKAESTHSVSPVVAATATPEIL